MHIKSIIIDGFKSYAKRTEITGFDPAFNAITGLNGSGKSNILDAICFLLGITNLSQVRAANLQELVYKSGQAGITTASVSIIFDNREKSSSPIGYEEYDELTVTRQIVVGGKNKYLINGVINPNNRVQDLFRSVQLNVNNPHFLIMQGRITKVLNMKPPEILSLLEEAANTKHYESKREDTLKTIEKKDGKLREIDKILNEDIKPTLAKLKRERTSYLEYQKVVRDLEYLNKFLVAYDYSNMKAIVDNADGEYNRLKDQLNHEEERIKQCDQQKVNLEENIDKLCEERDNVHMEKMQNMQTEFSEMQKQEAILKNAIKRAEEEVKEAKSNVAILKKQLKEDGDNQKKTQSEISKIQGKFEELKEKVEKSKSNCENAQQRLQEVNSGFFISETGNATGSLAELLAAAEKEESDLAIELNGLKMRLKHVTKVFEEISDKLRKTDKSDVSGKLERKQVELVNEIQKLESSANNIGFSQLEMEKLQNELLTANVELRKLEGERQNFIRRNQRLEFVYNKPSPNFDSRKIIGMVASLVTLTDMQFSLALEIAAGNRLYNVIIDHDSTGAELFEKNCLPNRTTLLPLNKMSSSPISDNTIKRAKNILGEDNVWSPMEIIHYDKSYHSAISFVFGTFLIARTLNMAKEVAFNKEINCRCVTLDGEIFDPEGTLVGGNRPVDTKIFENAHHLLTLDKAIGNLVQNRKLIDENLSKMSEVSKQFDEIQGKLRTHTLELRQLERQMMGDRYLDVKNEHVKIKTELDSINKNLSEKEKVHKTACDKTKVARENLANSASIQERAQKTAAANLKSAQEQLQNAEDAFKDIESRYETLTLECKENEQERNNLQSSIETAEIAVTEKIKISETANNHLVEHISKIKEFKVGLDEIKRVLRGVETRISECRESVKECGKTKDQAALKVSDLSHRISTHKKDSEDAEKKLKKLLSKYNWIIDESKHFNQPGGIYDFNNKDWKGAKQKIEQLEDEKRKLSRKIDLRGMNVLGQTEERYNDLMLKYQKVLQDKQVLQNVIDELDKLKDEVVKKAHEQVDRDFDKIFSTLLPGSQARLIPPEGKTLSDGLEFKIAFGNVWKDSLNELSGGQRSLVALSLILALLRFKPAPLYILDEVDAALDISHTQNIGTIIKEQFSNSQFIIVSLKDGMFNNANVLFKTKFVDGISTVSRQVNANRRPMTERNI